MQRFSVFLIIIMSPILWSGCSGLVKSGKKAIEPKFVAVEDPGMEIGDDLGLTGLSKVLKMHITYWSHPTRRLQTIKMGSQYSILASEYLKALKLLKKVVDGGDSQKVQEFINKNFQYIGVVADSKPVGWTFATSYYEPVLLASHKRTDLFSQPLYGVPENLVNVQMGEFAKTFSHWSVWEDQNTEQKSTTPLIRGRLTSGAEPLGIPNVVPFYSREEIDERGLLSGQASIFGYVHPVDAFFLQIQGSGVLQFSSKEKVRIGYAAQNGYPYSAIGRYMFDVIDRDNMSLQTIQEYLHRLPEGEMQEFLNRNLSYVFFRPLEGRGETYMGTEVVDGRTIATDYRIFPKGLLAHIAFETQLEGERTLKVSRLVIDQDTGGAIRGPHRVDLFWGQGRAAEAIAGQIKSPARIFYLLPRTEVAKAAHQ